MERAKGDPPGQEAEPVRGLLLVVDPHRQSALHPLNLRRRAGLPDEQQAQPVLHHGQHEPLLQVQGDARRRRGPRGRRVLGVRRAHVHGAARATREQRPLDLGAAHVHVRALRLLLRQELVESRLQEESSP